MSSEDNLQVLIDDSYLEPFKADILGRKARFENKCQEITEKEGGILQFCDKAQNEYGIIFSENGVTVREWLPLAKEMFLVGDFNEWNLYSHIFHKVLANNEWYGVWEIFLPKNDDGTHKLKHNQKIKLYIKNDKHEFVHRNMAYSRTLVQDEATKVYDTLVYNPENPYQFKNKRPIRPKNLKIYEAHVGMSSTDEKVSSYDEFRMNILPRIKENGYNCIQLMAIMEHAYYGSFGYHVTNFFAVSSRSGDPDAFKRLVDEAHAMGLLIIIDLVHSHASSNAQDGIGDMDGSGYQYFHAGEKGDQTAWDSKCFDYNKYEVFRFLSSNIRFWLKEYNLDGFRYDGVTSMMYHHHGIGTGFSGGYHEYFGMNVDEDAIIYLMMSVKIAKMTHPDCILIAEDVSGMPLLCRNQEDGGIGFDYRLAMALPDKWIKLLKETKDDDWSMEDLAHTLTNRRWKEPVVCYAESHDQAIVGDKTLSMWLFDKEIYDNMSTHQESIVVNRGMALHKMIRLQTLALGGESYLNFMGNEYGHPEWIDFPREQNGWSYKHCRRQWNLADDGSQRFKQLGTFDKAMNACDNEQKFLGSEHQYISTQNSQDKVLAFERGNNLFVFNFNTSQSFTDYKIGTAWSGQYEIIQDTDRHEFGGHGRVCPDPSKPIIAHEDHYNGRPCSLYLYLPNRCGIVLKPLNQ